MTSSSSATEQFLVRLGRGREEFLRDHFAAAWGSYERLTSLCTAGVRERTGFSHGAETDAEGFYVLVAHLHDENVWSGCG
jgi:hypothetical protein